MEPTGRKKKFGTRFEGSLRRLWQLPVYGENNPLFGLAAKNWLNMAAKGLTFQFMLDWIIWGAASMYATRNPYISVLVGIIPAYFIAMYDSSAMKADTSQSRWPLLAVGGRIIVALILCFISAVPLEIAVFSGEIEHNIMTRENENADKLRVKALETESEYFDTRITEERAAQNEAVSVIQGEKQADLDTYVQERKDKRAIVEGRYTDDKKRIEERVSKQDELMADESAGRYSGMAGIGPRVQAMEASKAAAVQELAQIREAQQAALVEFDKETDAQVVVLTQTRDSAVATTSSTYQTRIDKLVADKKAKLDQIRGMINPAELDKLAAQYSGTWREARGFLAMMEELDRMAEDSSTVYWSIWGARIFLAIMSIMVIGMKLMFPLDVIRSYSLSAQAAAGNEEAQQVAQGMGYGDFTAFATTPDVRAALEQIDDARRAVHQGLLKFQGELAKLARPQDNNLCMPIDQIRAGLQTWWVHNMIELMDELSRTEMAAKRRGITVPEWTQLGDLEDPRQNKKPWEVDESTLRPFGWIDPTTDIQNAKEALDGLNTQVWFLYRLGNELKRELGDEIRANPHISQQELEGRAQEFFLYTVLPVLEKITSLENLISKGGMDLPSWPTYLKDPRKDPDSYWKFETSTLQKLGWLGTAVREVRPTILDEARTIPDLPSRGNGDEPAPETDTTTTTTPPPSGNGGSPDSNADVEAAPAADVLTDTTATKAEPENAFTRPPAADEDDDLGFDVPQRDRNTNPGNGWLQALSPDNSSTTADEDAATDADSTDTDDEQADVGFQEADTDPGSVHEDLAAVQAKGDTDNVTDADAAIDVDPTDTQTVFPSGKDSGNVDNADGFTGDDESFFDKKVDPETVGDDGVVSRDDTSLMTGTPKPASAAKAVVAPTPAPATGTIPTGNDQA